MLTQKPIILATTAFSRAREALDKVGVKTGFGTSQKASEISLYDRIAYFVNVALGLVGIVATIYILYSGVRWMRAGGNDQEIKAAKDGLKNAVIGLSIVLLAYVIVNFVITEAIKVIQGTT